MSGGVYRTRLCARMAEVGAAAWDALLAAQPSPTPFMSHAYLDALQASGCAVAATGWQPLVLLLEDDDGLAAATPLYLKSHSWGEYVFDWAWADAYRRHGLAYYPKLLGAVPFTPVAGTRLMARDPAARRALAQAVLGLARGQGLSSAHLLFVDPADREALESAGWMLRTGVQFHWQQDPAAPARSFDQLLGSMQRHKRKNIAQERRRVREAGVTFRVLEGPAIGEEAWDFFHRCYTLTYEAHGSQPYLSRAFFAAVATSMAANWLMFVASAGDEPVAASLVAIDRPRRTAYGRYWGSTRPVPMLHFEACYYQPLEWCLAQGFERFEGGAQGEHKISRGLLPVRTHSAHWLADPRFASAVDDYLAREDRGIGEYLDELRERSPFRSPDAASPSCASPR
jgi:predicted N-acyltransferase